jgi:hypothetical protein
MLNSQWYVSLDIATGFEMTKVHNNLKLWKYKVQEKQ